MRRAARWAFLAVAGMAILDIDAFAHEVLGHGLTAVLFGSRLHYFYVSPLVGYANTWREPLAGWQELVVLAAGPLVTAGLGIASWWGYRRASGFAVRAALLVAAAYNVLTALVYGGLQPLIEPILGSGATGDIAVILRDTGLPALPLALVTLVIGSLVVAELMRDIRAFVQSELAPGAGPFTAAWLLVLPSVLLVSGYYIGVFPWLDDFARFAWPSGVLSALVLTLGGALVLRMRGGRSHLAAEGRDSDPLPSPLMGGFAAIAAGVLVIFGPTYGLARGVYVTPPAPQAVDLFIQHTTPGDVRVEIEPSGAVRLAITLSPTATDPLARRLEADLVATGPDDRVLPRAIGVVAEAIGIDDERQFGSDWARMRGATIERTAPATWVADAAIGAVAPRDLTLRMAPFFSGVVGRLEVVGPGLALVSVTPIDITGVGPGEQPPSLRADPGRIVWSGRRPPREIVLRWAP